MRYSANGVIAIKQPSFTKIEAQVKNGFAFNGNRINLIRAEVVLGFEDDKMALLPGDNVLLRGDAGLQAWAKAVLTLDDVDFVLCPVGSVIGYERLDDFGKPEGEE